MHDASTLRELAARLARLGKRLEADTAADLTELARQLEDQARRVDVLVHEPPVPAGDRACYRYRTDALVGPWRRRQDRALADAVSAGLAVTTEGAVQWRVSGAIEQSLCDRAGACGGAYPPD